MIRRTNTVSLWGAVIGICAVYYFVMRYSLVSADKIVDAGAGFQYNLISFSATLAGFLFTGIGILISALGNGRIKRLWDNHYLDNFYKGSFIGMGAGVADIVIAFVSVWCMIPEVVAKSLVKIEIFMTITMVVFFTWCVVKLFLIMQKLKE